MGAIETASGPGTSVDVGPESPQRDATATATTNKPGLLCKPSTGSYGNGVDITGAAYGSANADEGFIEQFTIEGTHPQSNTINDKATAYAVADPVSVKGHIIGKTYWLKGSSLTADVGDRLVCIAGGLVGVETEHTATPLNHHMWACAAKVASATWVQGTYLGNVSSFTTGA